MKRKAIRKKDRFEVFKRDKFKCQYCGKSAPEVILEIDHIIPVASGGDNNIMNLITACKDCNAGKKHYELNDDSVLSKQRRQLEGLQERREQLKLLAQWRDELKNMDSETADLVIKEIQSCYNNQYSVNDIGKNSVKTWLKKFTLQEILECIPLSVKYLKIDHEGKYTQQSVELFFDKIPKVIFMRRVCKEKPYLEDIFKIRSYMKYNYNYIKDYEVKNYLERLYELGYGIEDLRNMARSYSRYSEWEDEAQRLINSN